MVSQTLTQIVHTHVLRYTIEHLYCMNKMLCDDQPLGGASRGDVVKMHLANSYISFHAIPQGK